LRVNIQTTNGNVDPYRIRKFNLIEHDAIAVALFVLQLSGEAMW
jgi:hypothetical protein